MDGDQVQNRCLNGPARNTVCSNQYKQNLRLWPLAAHLDSEVGADFGSAVGWRAELGPWLTKISENDPFRNVWIDSG